MNKRTLLFRCRKNTKYNIDAFCRDCVNGTIYSEFLPYGELNVWIPPKFLEENGVSKEKGESTISNLINNCANNYYLACFSLTNPLTNRHLLGKYGGKDGFIVVYDYLSLRSDVSRESLINNKIVDLLNVHYSDRKYSLMPLIRQMVEIAEESERDGESFEERAMHYIETRKLSDEAGKCAMGIFCNKTNQYRIENEVRLVMQRINLNNKYPDLIKAKPIGVFISNQMNLLSRKRIEDHAKEIGILVEYY